MIIVSASTFHRVSILNLTNACKLSGHYFIMYYIIPKTSQFFISNCESLVDACQKLIENTRHYHTVLWNLEYAYTARAKKFIVL